MNDTATIPTPAITGAELRRIALIDVYPGYGMGLQAIGDLDVQLVRRGTTWTLYLSDLTPVPHETRDRWATAVSAPSVEWAQTPDGGSAWCSWTEPVKDSAA